MPSFNEILEEIGAVSSIHDTTRRRYLAQIHELTGRNVIIYYSGYLQKPGFEGLGIEERDKNGFMAAVQGLDRSLGLDLILHTPGGAVDAVESIVFYLQKMFAQNIRVIVPQIAMSGGTMISLAAREIIMGKQSSLGPIDPQFNGMSAHGILEEWQQAHQEMKADQSKAFVWHPILQKYRPTLIGECEKAIQWGNEMTSRWLVDCMFSGQVDAEEKAGRIVNELSDHALTKSHSRRVTIDAAKRLGLKIVDLEANQDLQDAVLSTHHAAMLTFERTPAYKIIENHKGIAAVLHRAMLQVSQQQF